MRLPGRREPRAAGCDHSVIKSHAVTTFPATMTRQIVFGAACWALSIAFFVNQAIVQAASARPYSLATNYISDLGNTACGSYSAGGYHADVCSPLHGLMNATFIVVGLLHVLGAILTRRAWPRRLLTSSGLALLALAGVGLILAGFAPENVNLSLHSQGALFGLDCLNVAMILLGLGLLHVARGLGAMALVAGLVGIVGSVLFMHSLAGLPVGTAERIADYPAAAMVVVLGAFLLGSSASARARAPLATP
jgi:hypothetical membrane protein